jgi:ribose/xylose/arabinose/galactoside ABC-type transport system permease subunit
VVVAFLIVFVAASLISSRFATTSNLLSILQAMTFEGLLAVGVGLVLIGGEIDISVGSTFSLAGVVAAVAMSHGASVAVAIAIALGVGLGCGVINGVVAELFQIPAVVVTLATLGVYAGLALVISGGSPVSSVGDHPGFFTGFGTGTVVGQLTWLSVIYVAVAVIAGAILQGTTFGFRVFAVGSNPRAARLVGINVPLIRIGLLTISGLTAGASAVLSLAYLQSASPISGTSYALDVLAAVIIGGVSLTGGRGTMLGVFLGLGVVQIISNMLTLTGVSPNWQSAVSGLVLVLAVGVQRLGVRRDARR